jgi:hypothetical protein
LLRTRALWQLLATATLNMKIDIYNLVHVLLRASTKGQLLLAAASRASDGTKITSLPELSMVTFEREFKY